MGQSAMQKRIFLISDDLIVFHSIQENMRDTQINICNTLSREDVLNCFSEQECCLAIIDVHLSKPTEMEILRAIREIRFMPILAITAELRPEEKVALLSAGADVCIEKSAGVSVYVAQANALIKLYMEINAGYKQRAFLSFGSELIISPRYRQVVIKGNPLVLTRKEFDLLHFLASNPKQVLSREEIYQHVWPDALEYGGEGTVKAHISTLLKKLAAVGEDYIENIWGVGYKFVPPNSKNVE